MHVEFTKNGSSIQTNLLNGFSKAVKESTE